MPLPHPQSPASAPPVAPLVDAFLDEAPMRQLLPIPPRALAEVMTVAHRCYQAGALADAEVLCKGLVAADHRQWWPRALYAAVLVKLGRPREALIQLDQGLRHHPEQPRLLAIKKEILATALRWAVRAAGRGKAGAPAAPPVSSPDLAIDRPEAA